jgi:hypothetical protein
MTLSERADACLVELDDAGKAIARRILLRLVRFGDGQADTHRGQPLSALQAGDDPERHGQILRCLADARLLGVDGDGDAQVDLAPDALSWPTLQAWIRTHGKAEQLRRRLETAAAQWQRAGQGRGDVELLDGSQLSEISAWLTADTQRELGVTDGAKSFVAASSAAARGGWWPARASMGSFLAILLMLLILATPIILLFVVVLTASVIHRLGGF